MLFGNKKNTKNDKKKKAKEPVSRVRSIPVEQPKPEEPKKATVKPGYKKKAAAERAAELRRIEKEEKAKFFGKLKEKKSKKVLNKYLKNVKE